MLDIKRWLLVAVLVLRVGSGNVGRGGGPLAADEPKDEQRNRPPLHVLQGDRAPIISCGTIGSCAVRTTR